MYDTIYRYLELLVQHASLVTDPSNIIPTLYFTQNPLYVDTLDPTRPAPLGVEHALASLESEQSGCIVHYSVDDGVFSMATPTIREPFVLDNKARAAELLVKWAEKNCFITITEVNKPRRTEKVVAQHKYNSIENSPRWLIWLAVGLVLLCACLFLFRFYSSPSTVNNVQATSDPGHQRSANVIDPPPCCTNEGERHGE